MAVASARSYGHWTIERVRQLSYSAASLVQCDTGAMCLTMSCALALVDAERWLKNWWRRRRQRIHWNGGGGCRIGYVLASKSGTLVHRRLYRQLQMLTPKPRRLLHRRH